MIIFNSYFDITGGFPCVLPRHPALRRPPKGVHRKKRRSNSLETVFGWSGHPGK